MCCTALCGPGICLISVGKELYSCIIVDNSIYLRVIGYLILHSQHANPELSIVELFQQSLDFGGQLNSDVI